MEFLNKPNSLPEQYLTDIERQRIRKANLQRAITEKFNDDIEKFAVAVNKHRNFIYALLWDINKPNARKISDKMARYIEKHAGFEYGYLDYGPRTTERNHDSYKELLMYKELLQQIIEMQDLILEKHAIIKGLIK